MTNLSNLFCILFILGRRNHTGSVIYHLQDGDTYRPRELSLIAAKCSVISTPTQYKGGWFEFGFTPAHTSCISNVFTFVQCSFMLVHVSYTRCLRYICRWNLLFLYILTTLFLLNAVSMYIKLINFWYLIFQRSNFTITAFSKNTKCTKERLSQKKVILVQ